MQSGREFLQHSQRRTAQTLALGLGIAAGLVLIVSLVYLALSPSLGLLIYAGLVTLVGICAVITTRLLPHRPVWSAVLPITFGMVIAVIIVALVFPAIRLAVLMILAVIQLIGSLGAERRQIVVRAIVFAVLGAGLALLPPGVGPNLELGPIAALLPALALLVLIGMTALLSERLLAAQEGALALVDQRAAEVEQARRVAEAARVEAEQRNAELRQALDLVVALELPVIKVGEGVLAAPLVGALDRERLDRFRASLLRAVSQEHARRVVIDLTGLPHLDSAVAHGLLETGQALRLLGAEALVCGIHPAIARALVALDLPLSELTPVAALATALRD